MRFGYLRFTNTAVFLLIAGFLLIGALDALCLIYLGVSVLVLVPMNIVLMFILLRFLKNDVAEIK